MFWKNCLYNITFQKRSELVFFNVSVWSLWERYLDKQSMYFLPSKINKYVFQQLAICNLRFFKKRIIYILILFIFHSFTILLCTYVSEINYLCLCLCLCLGRWWCKPLPTPNSSAISRPSSRKFCHLSTSMPSYVFLCILYYVPYQNRLYFYSMCPCR